MKRPRLVAIFLLVAVPTLTRAADPILPYTPLDPARIKQIEAMLPEKPTGMGAPITDRAAWDALAGLPTYQKMLASADKFLADPIPPQPDSLYLLYTQTGDRDQWQNVAFDRRNRFSVLVLAECIRNDGRYIPKIAELLAAFCAENTWVYPAHNGSLTNFKKQAIDIELGSSTLAFNIATAYWMLGDKLPAASRKLIVEELDRRIISPFRERYTGKTPLWWWMTTEMNWNSVCLAGVTGTALATVQDRHTRAEFVAAAEIYSDYFLKGFPADGYCTEGLGYWNYGFGRYVMLSETVRRATGGKVDLLARPAAELPAHFGDRIQIMNGISPAFADCPLNAKPDRNLMHLLNSQFHLGLPAYNAPDTTSSITDLATEAVYRVDIPADKSPPAPYRLRDFFDATGILIARPAQNSACKMGVALKGGNNNESHNHNDIGSYVVLVNDKELILDPGPERYTARTFSDKRYDSNLLNSFGHDVPLIAGQLQRTGAEAQAKVIKDATHFSDAGDTLSLDITSAYGVKELTSLIRVWTYSREKLGSLTVTDKAVFTTPQSFGTTLLTLGKWSKQPDGTLLIQDGKESVIVTIRATGDYTLDEDIIKDTPKDEGTPAPTRIGINLKEKSLNPTITLSIIPR